MAKKIIIRGIIGISEKATPEHLASELAAANGEEVVIFINSGGGFMFPGIEMANMIRNYSGKTTARITGVAASMASYIPMMADVVEVEDNVTFMIHNPFGFAAGDFREMEKSAQVFEGLAALLAKAYAAKSNIPVAQIRKMMNDETFLFGEKIAAKGFADSVIATEDKGEGEAKGISSAAAEIAACFEAMKKTKQTDDSSKIAAFLGDSNLTEEIGTKPEPKSEHEPTPEKSKMNLAKFLKENPEAKAEHDAELAKAQTAGEKAKETDMKSEADEEKTAAAKAENLKTAVAEGSKIIASAEYPDDFKEKITGLMTNGDHEGIKAAVAERDQIVEKVKSDMAKEGQPGDTPPTAPQGSGTGEIQNSADLDKEVTRFQAQYQG